MAETNAFVDKKKRMQSFRKVVSPPKNPALEIEIPVDEYQQQQKDDFQARDDESEMIRRGTEMSGFSDGTLVRQVNDAESEFTDIQRVGEGSMANRGTTYDKMGADDLKKVNQEISESPLYDPSGEADSRRQTMQQKGQENELVALEEADGFKRSRDF